MTGTAVSVETLEELKETWLRQITCIFHNLNYDVKIDLLTLQSSHDLGVRGDLFFFLENLILTLNFWHKIQVNFINFCPYNYILTQKQEILLASTEIVFLNYMFQNS